MRSLDRGPAVRASAVRDTLAYLDKFEAGSRARVLERVPAEARAIIESTPGTDWISVEHDHWTVDAIIEVLGRPRAIQCWRGALGNLVERPLLRSFVSATLKALGRNPVGVVRLLAKGWPLVYRDVCEPKLIATVDGQPTIRFDHIAPAVQRYRNYLDSWYGGVQGFADLAGVRGHVELEVAPDVSWAEAKFFWNEHERTPKELKQQQSGNAGTKA